MSRAACTIVSPNYLAYALTLCSSYLQHHPDDRFYVLIVADLKDSTPFTGRALTPVLLQEIGLSDLRAEAMKYDILELNTNVKPTFMKYLVNTYKLDQLVYLDPDIFCYAPLDPVFEALDRGATGVLTPHMTAPVFDGMLPGEQEMLYNGTYNLGFLAIRRCDESLRLLDWWEERCLTLGFSEGRTGLFVDQKWMNLAPGMFEGICILRDAGCNMAYWNLYERTVCVDRGVYMVDTAANGRVPLRFFHFSGIDVSDPASLSKNTNRFALTERTDLQEIFSAYKSAVLSNRGIEMEALPYGFDRLSDGSAVTRLARRLYAAHQEHFAGEDPFDAAGSFARFAKKMGLIKGMAAPQKQTWRDFNPKDRRVEMVHRVLKLVLRVIGPDKYELLMRYLAHIAVLRHQSVFLNEGLPKKVDRDT